MGAKNINHKKEAYFEKLQIKRKTRKSERYE